MGAEATAHTTKLLSLSAFLKHFTNGFTYSDWLLFVYFFQPVGSK